jgi:hypothetical protein
VAADFDTPLLTGYPYVVPGLTVTKTYTASQFQDNINLPNFQGRVAGDYLPVTATFTFGTDKNTLSISAGVNNPNNPDKLIVFDAYDAAGGHVGVTQTRTLPSSGRFTFPSPPFRRAVLFVDGGGFSYAYFDNVSGSCVP